MLIMKTIYKTITKTPVIILCGGKGERLKSVSGDMPKALVPIAGKPFISILLKHLSEQGFCKFILCVGYRKNLVIDYFSESDYNISFSVEERPLGTGGAIKKVILENSLNTCLVMNGDSFCKTDFNKFFDFHLKRKNIMSIVLAQHRNSTNYGVVTLNKNHRIVSFNEKVDCQRDRYVNAGIYLMNRDMLNHMPDKEQFSLEYDVFPQMIKLDCFGFVSDGELIDIGTPERLKRAQKYFFYKFSMRSGPILSVNQACLLFLVCCQYQ